MRWVGIFIFLWSVTGFGCDMRTVSEKPTTFGVKDYLTRAYAAVDTLEATEAITRGGDAALIFVDVREGDEVEKHGQIPGSVHIPRGVLEFYIDKTSSLHHEVFSSGKTLVFYCETGGRSVLAARLAMDMGLGNVAYLGGGFTAWTKSGGTVNREEMVGD